MAAPAYHGYVETALDALLIIQGCNTGTLPLVTRRLLDAEKKATVVSGSVFVWDESATGIRRWTDGMTWSPSRTLGNFLVYRELDKKAKVVKQVDAPPPSRGGPMSDGKLLGELSGEAETQERVREKALVGSLTSSYRFRKEGLVKKTISLGGLHLIGYYTIDDVIQGALQTPSSHPALLAQEIHPRLLEPAGFRIPIQTEMGRDGVVRYVGEVETNPTASPGSENVPAGGMPAPPRSSSSYPRSMKMETDPSLGNAPIIPSLPSMSTFPPLRDSPRNAPRNAPRINGNRYEPYTISRSPSMSAGTFTPHQSPPTNTSNGYAQYSTSATTSNVENYSRMELERPDQQRFGRMEQERVHYFADRVRPSSSGGVPVVTGPRQWQRGSQVLVRGQSEQGISTSYPEFQTPYSIAYPSYDLGQENGSQANRLPPMDVRVPTQSNQVFAFEPPSLGDSTNSSLNGFQASYLISTPQLSHDVDSYSTSKFDTAPTYWPRPSAVPPLSAVDSRSYSLDASMYSSHSNSPPTQRRASSFQQPRQAPFDAYSALSQASYPNYAAERRAAQPVTLQQYEDAYEYSDRSNREQNGVRSMEHSPEVTRAHLMQRRMSQEEEAVAMRRRLSEREERQIVNEEVRHREQTRRQSQANW